MLRSSYECALPHVWGVGEQQGIADVAWGLQRVWPLKVDFALEPVGMLLEVRTLERAAKPCGLMTTSSGVSADSGTL